MSISVLVLIAAVFIAGGSMGAFLMVLIGIRTEERHMSLTSGPYTAAGASTRRLLSVYVRVPDPAPHEVSAPRETAR